jgi:FtsP/CotA-like multicopper oxidase with cupredoxin domain
LIEPITLTSKNGVLDILMIARAAPINTLPSGPIGWVFQICARPSNKSDACPTEVGAIPNYYGGTRLQLERGDLLKIRLVNQLPLALDSEHATEPDQQYLMLNPVNLHTDGLIVSPHGPTDGDPTYGDNVFVLTFNSGNGKPTASPRLHATVRYDYTDYSIRIPIDHPSGVFWFHPETHGLALNQISAGLGGIITVGHVNDYVCKGTFCSLLLPQIGVRHIILKDTQILPDGSQQTQEDPAFSDPKPFPGEGQRVGITAGADTTNMGGRNYKNGNWYFTLNGSVYPTVFMNEPAGEIWRITNASGSATYDLNLFNPAQNRNMIMQVISADGVSISPDALITTEELAEVGGAKFKPEPCPAAPSLLPSTSQAALCTREVLMMPGSRVEVWVSYRDSKDMVAPTPRNSYAVLRTAGYQTGPAGDSWPAVDLARVNFVSPVQINTPPLLGISGEANTVASATALAKDLSAANKTAPTRVCQALAPGHMRRIFYAVPTTDQNAFGLAYEEVDENGNIVGPAATDVAPFDQMKDSICLPLGPGNTPVYERWQLVNVAEEDHDFHIAQTKFRVLTKDEQSGAMLPGASYGKGIEFDNIPLPHADGTCGSNPPADLSNPISDWRAGLCQAHPITVEIQFVAAGTFVYRCHIGEHEDGGMMAVIQVAPAQ